MTHNIHLVGSVGLEDADTVFRILSDILGDKAKRYPDGETGERHYWVIWQGQVFARHPEFEAAGKSVPINPGSTVPQKFRLRDGADVGNLEFPPIGYAREALHSYLKFTELRDAGVVPPGVRFQVSLPTPLARLPRMPFASHSGS